MSSVDAKKDASYRLLTTGVFVYDFAIVIIGLVVLIIYCAYLGKPKVNSVEQLTLGDAVQDS